MNGVERKRQRITQEDCDIARFFTRRGMKMNEIAKMLKVDASTISKMKAGDFRLEQYLEIRKESNRKQTEKKAEDALNREQKITPAPSLMQLAGQMEMNLNQEAEAPEMSEAVKMKRFLAGQIGEIVKALNGITEELKKMNESLHELRKE